MSEPVNHASRDGATTFCGVSVTDENFRIGGVSCPNCMEVANGPSAATINTMPNQPKTPITAIRIPLELKGRVARKAAAEGTSLSAVVIAALEAYAPAVR